MLGEGKAYCTGCGKPREIVGTGTVDGPQKTVDARYVLVQCGSVKRPGVFNMKVARSIIRDRRNRVKARRAAIKATYAGTPEGQRRLALKRVR